MRTAFFTHPRFFEHDMGAGHPECPARLEAIDEALRSTGLIEQLDLRRPRAAHWNELQMAHDAVYLSTIRQRLQEKSGELKIQLLPVELGLDETVTSGDAVRTRMLQLKAVEKLADLALDRQIQRLVEIYPLAPVVHTDKKGRRTFEELPVRMECDVDFEHLYTFFQSVFEENQVFTFRNVRIESGPTFDSKLRVKAILSALLFE